MLRELHGDANSDPEPHLQKAQHHSFCQPVHDGNHHDAVTKDKAGNKLKLVALSTLVMTRELKDYQGKPKESRHWVCDLRLREKLIGKYIYMSTNLLEMFGDNSVARVEAALDAMRKGRGVLVVDNANRENEGDLIFAAETMTSEQMAFMIRECSGIVCVCIKQDRADRLGLPMMVSDNTSTYGTAFTISVDAAENVTTGVSAKDRIEAIKVILDENTARKDLAAPGHMFPLVARPNGVLERDGHTEASCDLARLAGFKPVGVLCELCAPDGDMARLPRVCAFAQLHDMTVVSIEDIQNYRREKNC